MDGPTRMPPRFVPTLTTVVALDAETVPAAEAAAVPAAGQPGSGGSGGLEATPPPASDTAPDGDGQDALGSGPTATADPDRFKALSPLHEADAFRIEEELLHRVLQRIDLSLEERLTDVVSATVQQQLDAMVPRLRQQMESALRQLVVEAMAQELLENPGSAAGSGAPSLG